MQAVLLDVGGTLWPDRWLPSEEDIAERIERVGQALPAGSSRLAPDLVRELEETAEKLQLDGKPGGTDLAQETDHLVRETLVRLGLPADPPAVLGVRRAMVAPAPGIGFLFPGAVDLLSTVRELGLRSVAISNTVWRDSQDYLHDFERLGLGNAFDAVMTSLDVKFRKPHAAIFRAAFDSIGWEPAACVGIGNSEQMDVEPAIQFGMRAIRVAVEEPSPVSSQAHAVVESLAEAAEVLRCWVR